MKGQDIKNLVHVCFCDKENKEFMDFLNNRKEDYKFETETHFIGQPCTSKPGYKNKLYILYAEKENELDRLKDEHDKYKDKMKGSTTILCAPFEASQWVPKLEVLNFIKVSDFQKASKELESLFDRSFELSGSLGIGAQKGEPPITKQHGIVDQPR
jgi:hypothetical protein